jgi:shikimate kinase
MKIFLIGFMGSGKTYWGRQLSQKLGIPFFDLDEQVEEHAGQSVEDIFKNEGEEQFRQKEKDILHLITESHESFVMACGGGSPCYMNRSGTTIWINSTLDTLYDRLVSEKDKRPLIKELSGEQLKYFIGKKFAGRKIYYEQANITVEDDPMMLDSMIQRIFHE